LSHPATGLSIRVYRYLLSLYPKGLRDGYAEAQVETFEEWIEEARARRGLAGVAAVWGEAAGDWAWSMAQAHVEATTPAEAVRAASGVFLAASLAMWAMIAASMVGHMNWATAIVETHTRPNTWIALGAPCAAVVLAALANPWRSGRLTPVLALSVFVCGSAWCLALSTWHG
jgi:hypothetical protein